jgi:hypothetical protein
MLNRPSPSRRSLLRSAAAVAAASLAAPYVITPSRVFAADPAGADGYIPLFDGKTLNGWHKNPQKIGHGTGGKWDVKEGAITGEPDPPNSGKRRRPSHRPQVRRLRAAPGNEPRLEHRLGPVPPL